MFFYYNFKFLIIQKDLVLLPNMTIKQYYTKTSRYLRYAKKEFIKGINEDLVKIELNMVTNRF